MPNARLRFVGSALLLTLPGAAPPSDFVIHDGDTLTVKGRRVRLWGIDAPELKQRCNQNGRLVLCGQMSREALMMLMGRDALQCDEIERDSYGRMVARCRALNADLSRAMVAAGWALDYPRYSGGAFQREQDQARQARRGLWAMRFQAPWEWRHKR